MPKSVQTVVAVFFALVVGSAVYGADVAKIGVVDLSKVFEHSEAGKAAQAEIKQKGRVMEAELKQMGAQIEDLEKRLDREAAEMSKDMREEKQRELRILVSEFETAERRFKAELKDLNNRLSQRIREEVLGIAEEIGKKEGYLLIRNKAGVLYSPSSNDITEQVINAYNRRFGRPAGAAGKSGSP
ncbi:MAG: OmpH family outer membrane protein [Desulfobacterales bacterium]